MPFHYAPLQNPNTTQDRELEASFDSDDSDVEENGTDDQAESRPLNPSRSRTPANPPSGPVPYNFENLDYDYPPPGSPPEPSSFALPNGIGNSNGLLPQPPQIPRPQRSGWFSRTAGVIFPNHSATGSTSSGRLVGGGIENDGVFANINAKPGRGRVIQDGDSGIHVVPEEVQKESPPSYASAQADAVPPYWETTIHAPTSFGGIGEMMVDGLPTGSSFSFLWNLLVSMSFQFVGFLLTFLLHSTHAAKLGSRAGLGITLIHYGFYLRARDDTYGGGGVAFLTDTNDDAPWMSPTAPSNPIPTFGTAAEAEGYYATHPGAANETTPTPPFPSSVMRPMLSEGASEWMSFLLMTVGWFILLTSTLSFWRVKRWERSIMASTPMETPVDNSASHAHNPFYALERFGFPGSVWRSRNDGQSAHPDQDHDEEAMLESDGTEEQQRMLPVGDSPEEVQRAGRIAQARATDLRLQRDLRAAGLL